MALAPCRSQNRLGIGPLCGIRLDRLIYNRIQPMIKKGVINMMPIRAVLRFVVFAMIVLFVRGTPAQDLVKPAANAPQYQLSNLRTETDRFGRSGIAVDFRRTRLGEGSVSVSGKSARGQLSISAWIPASEESGTIQLESLFGGNIATDIELYLVQDHRLSANKTVYAMVSNAVRIGNPGPSPTPREWTAEEKAMYQEFIRIMNDDSAHKPPAKYPVSVKTPEASQFVPNIAKLTKGTRLHACYQNKWYPLTTISENDDGTVNVRWDDFGAKYDCSMNRGELVIANNVLAALGKHPATKFPETVPNWASEAAKKTEPGSPPAVASKMYPISIAIPGDSQLVPQDLKLKPGIPLQACYASKWNPITTLAENDDGTLKIRWDEYGPAFDCNMVREELIIKKDLAQQLRTNPSAVKVAAPTADAKPLKSYPVSIAIPRDSEFVPTNVELKPGTKLQACYAGKWNPMTLLSTNADGTLTVRWDDWGATFDCSMQRNELIIKKSILKDAAVPKESAAAKDSTAAKDSATPSAPTPEMRTFTDITGKFKVKAKIVKQTDKQVTLLTEQGKEVTLPIARLSETDQEFVRSIANPKNPFE